MARWGWGLAVNTSTVFKGCDRLNLRPATSNDMGLRPVILYTGSRTCCWLLGSHTLGCGGEGFP